MPDFVILDRLWMLFLKRVFANPKHPINWRSRRIIRILL